MNEIIEIIVNGIQEVFNILQSFPILGTNMLTFIITILIIGSVLPILLTLVKTTNAVSERNYNERMREAKREERKKTK